MRLTVLGQIAKGLAAKLESTAASELECLKWFLWHGNAFRSLQVIDDLKIDVDVEDPTPQERKLYKALAEFGHYIDANAAWIPNYGVRGLLVQRTGLSGGGGRRHVARRVAAVAPPVVEQSGASGLTAARPTAVVGGPRHLGCCKFRFLMGVRGFRRRDK